MDAATTIKIMSQSGRAKSDFSVFPIDKVGSCFGAGAGTGTGTGAVGVVGVVGPGAGTGYVTTEAKKSKKFL
jgi:hypothetical protein